jgi:hypothetical protein
MSTLRYNSVNSVIIEAAMQYFLHRSNMSTLRYNSVNSVIIGAAMQVLSTYSYVESMCMAGSIITLFTLLYLSVDILLLCRKHVHGRFYNNTVRAVMSECWHITPAMQVLST